MTITKPAKAGTLESNDIYITILPYDCLKIELDSVVDKQFGPEIKNVILSTLEKHNIKNALVKATDKGALNYTIEARVETAILRGM